MRFYFSGVESLDELEMLREAGVSRLLVNPEQLQKLDGYLDGFRIALDSPAYRVWKSGQKRDISEYAEFINLWSRSYKFDFVTSYDNFDDADQSYWDWLDLLMLTEVDDILPVWHWNQDELEIHDLIHSYLEKSDAVGIGGLVPYLFSGAHRGEKKACRESVKNLCRDYPGRFRLFGACDIPLLNSCRESAVSADSSLWLRGRRRGVGFYINSRTGLPAQASPWLMQKLAPIYPEIKQLLQMDGRERNISNARLLEQYFNSEQESEKSEPDPKTQNLSANPGGYYAD